jgi:hypothetical protein
MKNERIEILQKVANGELTPEQADEQLLGLSIVSNWVSAEPPPQKKKKAGRYLVKTDDRIELAEYEPIYKEWIGNACLGVMKDVKQWAEIPCC